MKREVRYAIVARVADLRRVGRLVLVILLAMLSLCFGPRALAEIDLRSFTAVRQSDRSILVRWETGSERSTVLFRLYRSETSADNGQSLTTVPHEGDSVTGAKYKYTDPESNLVAGRTYYYRLEEIDSSGKSSWFGPVSAQAASAPISTQFTSTPIDVATATRRFTNTPIVPTALPTTPTPPPAAPPSRPNVTRVPIGPAAVTSPTPAAAVVAAPPPPTQTPLIPTPSPTLEPTDTATPTSSPTPRPTPTVTRTPSPLVFAAQGAGEARESTATALPPPATATSPLRSLPPTLTLAGGAIALAAAIGLLALVLRRSSRA